MVSGRDCREDGQMCPNGMHHAACCHGLVESQAAVWYEEGISKLVSRYDKCLSVQGGYVEK